MLSIAKAMIYGSFETKIANTDATNKSAVQANTARMMISRMGSCP